MSEIKLLPCPFCGGEAMLTNQLAIDEYGHKLWNVLCVNCDNRTSSYWDKNHVVEKWTTRKPMQEIVERMRKLDLDGLKMIEDDKHELIRKKEAIELVEEVGGMND